MSDDGLPMRGLTRVAAGQVAASVLVAGVAVAVVPTPARDDVIASVAVVLVAMLIGLAPMRVLLRRGPEQIVAGWVAAMIVRMAAALAGLVLLIVRYRLDVAACVWTTCGVYLLLLMVEAIGMAGLVRREFERRGPRRPETDD